MSRLDELIKELCPDGVEYREISTAVNIVGGKDYKNLNEGEIPVYGSGGVMCYVDKAAYDKPSVLLPRKGSISNVFYVTEPFWNVDTIFYTEIDLEQLIPRYFYHVMLNAHIEDYNTSNAARPALTRTVLNKIKIPIPPLPVQEEIVKILDKFTDYVTELQAELQARKQQYEYYRGYLLSGNGNVEQVELRSVVKKSCSGGTPKKTNKSFYENGNIPWIRTQDVKFNDIVSVDSYITEEAVAKTSAKWIPKNCVIVAISGASAGRCAINKIRATTNQHCLNLEIDEEKALYKYVYYCVHNQYQELLDRKQGARGDLNSSLILGINIPLPSLEEQKRIVRILDGFNNLISGIESGLPIEIEARQKQYEYYRDKLLSFKKIES